jgi:hypothetical protein
VILLVELQRFLPMLLKIITFGLQKRLQFIKHFAAEKLLCAAAYISIYRE